MGLYCNNKFCIYYESSHCLLDSNSLDESGICQNIYYVELEKEFLDVQRKKLLKKFEQLGTR